MANVSWWLHYLCVGKSFGISIVRFGAVRGAGLWKESTQKTDDCKSVWQFDGQYMSSDTFGMQSKIASQLDVIFNINTRAGDSIKCILCQQIQWQCRPKWYIFAKLGSKVLPPMATFLDKLVLAQAHKTFKAFQGKQRIHHRVHKSMPWCITAHANYRYGLHSAHSKYLCTAYNSRAKSYHCDKHR